MNYKGRVISIAFVAVILLFIRQVVIMHFGRAPHPLPLPMVIPLIIAWYGGKQYDKYMHLSTRDSLTGLFNRRYVLDTFSRTLSKAKRKKVNIAVLLLDLNDFKEINDTYGHDTGDKVLESISKLLKVCFDRNDIISRWGGDEFLIVSSFADKKVIENKLSHFKNKIKSEDCGYHGLSVSIGRAIYPFDATDLESLIAKADSDMYRLKMDHKQIKAVSK